MVAIAAAGVEALPGLFQSPPGSPEFQLAYLDPGAGSFVIQALVAMLAGIVVAVKVYWQRIKGFLGMASPSGDDDEPVEPRDGD